MTQSLLIVLSICATSIDVHSKKFRRTNLPNGVIGDLSSLSLRYFSRSIGGLEGSSLGFGGLGVCAGRSEIRSLSLFARISTL
jgi:hypothetical protein